MARKNNTQAHAVGTIPVITGYVAQTAHGYVRVGDALARWARAEECIAYAASRVLTTDKGRGAAPSIPVYADPECTRPVSWDNAPATPAPVKTRASKAQAPAMVSTAPTGETRKERNRRLWAAFVAQGGSNADGGASWLAFKAAQPDNAPARVVNTPATPAPKKARKPASARQIAHRALFAEFCKLHDPDLTWEEFKAGRAMETPAQPTPAPVKTPPVVTVQTVKATPPTTRARASAVKLAPVTQAAPVAREVSAHDAQTPDTMADWVLSQPDPARVDIRDLIRAFPQVNNNARLAAMKLAREVLASV